DDDARIRTELERRADEGEAPVLEVSGALEPDEDLPADFRLAGFEHALQTLAEPLVRELGNRFEQRLPEQVVLRCQDRGLVQALDDEIGAAHDEDWNRRVLVKASELRAALLEPAAPALERRLPPRELLACPGSADARREPLRGGGDERPILVVERLTGTHTCDEEARRRSAGHRN